MNQTTRILDAPAPRVLHYLQQSSAVELTMRKSNLTRRIVVSPQLCGHVSLCVF